MKTVSQILGVRRGRVISVSPQETVLHALGIMAEHEIGALVVLVKGQLVGVISERDYARKVALSGKTSRDTLVEQIMAHPVICAPMDATLEDAMALMSEHCIRHLPVLDDHKELIGVVSIRDLVREMLSEQTFVIRQLESYVHSNIGVSQ